MKFKKSLIAICLMTIFSGILVGAKPEKAISAKSPVVIGEVLEVQKSEDGNTRVTIQGYIKGKEVSRITVVGMIDNETKVMNSTNDKEEDIVIDKGDLVYARVNEAMTKSEPPQTVIKRIFITKNK